MTETENREGARPARRRAASEGAPAVPARRTLRRS